MIPSGRLWLILCLLALPTIAAGFLTGLGPLIVLLDVCLLVVAAADFALARRVPIKVWRELPAAPAGRRAQPGHPAPRQHRLARRCASTLRDDSPQEFESRPAVLSLTVSANSRAKLALHDHPARSAGKFAFGDLHLRVRGPFGFVWHERMVPGERRPSACSPTCAAPAGSCSPTRRSTSSTSGCASCAATAAAPSSPACATTPRATRCATSTGRPPPAAARPVTRVMESERSQTVLIGVDAGRSMAARVDGLTKLDHAVNAALFLAFVAVRNGDRVGLVVFADGVKTYLAPSSGRLQYRKIVDALYTAKPHLTYVDYLALFKELNVRLLQAQPAVRVHRLHRRGSGADHGRPDAPPRPPPRAPVPLGEGRGARRSCSRPPRPTPRSPTSTRWRASCCSSVKR